jgi:hypothetical protein
LEQVERRNESEVKMVHNLTPTFAIFFYDNKFFPTTSIFQLTPRLNSNMAAICNPTEKFVYAKKWMNINGWNNILGRNDAPTQPFPPRIMNNSYRSAINSININIQWKTIFKISKRCNKCNKHGHASTSTQSYIIYFKMKSSIPLSQGTFEPWERNIILKKRSIIRNKTPIYYIWFINLSWIIDIKIIVTLFSNLIHDSDSIHIHVVDLKKN